MNKNIPSFKFLKAGNELSISNTGTRIESVIPIATKVQCTSSSTPIEFCNGSILFIPFLIDHLTPHSSFIIGIADEKMINLNELTYYLKNNCYGLHNAGHAYSHDKSEEYGVELEKDFKCTLKLDFENDVLSYVINGLNRGVAFKKIGLKERKYHLVV